MSTGKFVINAVFDSSITTASNAAQIEGAINAAVDFYEHAFSNNMTMTIDFGYGEVDGAAISSSNLAQSKFTNASDYTYSQVETALASHDTSPDGVAAVNTLPATDPTGAGKYLLTQAEALALGLQTSNAIDLYVGLSSTNTFTYDPNNRAVTGEHDAIGAMEHEISEVMGRYGSLGQNFGANVYEPLDLFRYYSAGNRDLSYGTNSSAAEYFSINGSQMLMQYNNPLNGGDVADWLPSIQGDSYGDGYKDTIANVSATDLREMNVLGYQRSPATENDFNGYGLSGLIWQNGTAFTEWQSNSNNSVTPNVDVGSVGAGWTLAGTGDFNGDVMADLIWQDGTTFSEWQSTGNGFTPNVDIWSVGAGWTLAGVGDFNDNSMADLIWQNGTTFSEWQSTGNAFAQNVDVGSVAAGWSVAAVGDFNGDGDADLIWQNGTIFTEWQSTGNAFTQNVDVGSVGAGWNIVGSGDFNGDGKTDLIWENGGAFSEWQSTGNGFTQNAYVGSLGSGWSVAAIGDFNGDGMSDILFRNTNGTFTEWQSTGTGFTQNVLVNSSVGTAWSLEYSPSKG